MQHIFNSSENCEHIYRQNGTKVVQQDIIKHLNSSLT